MAGLNLCVSLTNDQAERCALFLRRLRFDQVLDLIPPDKAPAARSDSAHETLTALAVIADALQFHGY